MRHFYFRLIFGIVWLLSAIVSLFSGAFPFAAFNLILGLAFLNSARTIWKEKE